MKVGRYTFFLVITLTFLLPLVAKDVIVQSKWAPQPIALDANSEDWSPELLNNWDKFKVDYGFLNDGVNLYGIIILNDRDYWSTISQTGLTIWINTEGKKKKKIGVHYRLRRVSGEEMVAILEKKEGTLSEERKAEILSRPQYMYYEGQFIDKKGNPLEVTPVGEDFILPTFRTNRVQGKLIYEFRLPLNIKELYEGAPPDLTKELRIGFEWGGMTKEMRAEMMKKRAAAEARASAGSATSDLRRERSVRDFDAPLRRPKKYSFWVGLKLASQ
ncbi:hypothetical protein NLC35_01775 [Candidatus Aminicenantes bacterium AC-334-K16]|jgi:hypothetical protein|nr:hypothetical protein [Candidatus Aminicenantes bacterium AC-334-K16]